MLASKINGLFEDCFQRIFPVKKEERSFHVQLQMSDTLRVEKLTLLAGTDTVKPPFPTTMLPHIALRCLSLDECYNLF